MEGGQTRLVRADRRRGTIRRHSWRKGPNSADAVDEDRERLLGLEAHLESPDDTMMLATTLCHPHQS